MPQSSAKRGFILILGCCIIFCLVTVVYGAFTVLGYALLSISTIPHGHALSVLYASLIGGIIVIPPVCIACPLILHAERYSYYRFVTQWMKYVPRIFITPVFLGGSTLGMAILRQSSFDAGTRIDMGHLVAASALGGSLFEIIYEGPRALISSLMCPHCFGERDD